MRVISGTARGTNLYTLEGNATRPTLDRVKESIFNILQNQIQEAKVLDLFAGSGALGIETLSRGASSCIFCDISQKAIQIIEKNIKKTHLQNKSEILKADYKTALKNFQGKQQFDIIFLDPPYEANLAVNAVEQICHYQLLSDTGITIIETDEEEREIEGLTKLNVNVYDLRKYGRVKLIFLNRKG